MRRPRRAWSMVPCCVVALATGDLACSSPDAVARDGGLDASAHPRGGSPDGSRDAAIEATRDAPREAVARDAKTPADGGLPYLSALSVTSAGASDASPPLALVPPFSPTTFDYYVRCAAGTNALEVSMTASAGAESRLVQPTPSSPSPTQTLSVDALEDQAIVAEADLGADRVQYWVRCLPHDFPKLSMVLHPEAGAPIPGYYVLGNRFLVAGDSAYAMVLDGHGVPVWYSRPTSDGLGDTESLATGEISFCQLGAPRADVSFEVHSLSPLTTTEIVTRDLDSHDLRLLPNGHYLVFAVPLTPYDLTGFTLPLADGGMVTFDKDASIVSCDIRELDPATGKIFWRWSALDHFDPIKDLEIRTSLVVPAPDTLDPFHCNSIAVDANGDLLVSGRHMNSVFYIDRKTGGVLWKMGGARFCKDDAVYVPVADPFHGQHDARLQPSWSYSCGGGRGEISMYDDETTGPGPARGVVYDVKVPPPGDAGASEDCGAPVDSGTGHATASRVWQYEGPLTAASEGSFRILPDGSRVIGWGYSPAPLAFTEVDSEGHDLLDFSFTDGSFTYRAVKVPLSGFDLDVLRATTAMVGGMPDAGSD